MSLGIAASNGISSFSVVNEAEQSILTSENENKRSDKVSIQSNSKVLEKKRQERVQNLEERLKMAGHGQSGCFKYLKIIITIVSVVSSVFTMGGSLGLLAVTVAMRIAAAALTAIGAITNGLMDLKTALDQKKLIMNAVQGQNILSIIDETKKWIEDEKSHLDDSHQRERNSLDEYKQTLSDLEQSFQTLIKI